MNEEKTMKLPLGILLVMATVLGFLIGTESGRQQRESLMRVIRREEATDESIEAVADAVTAAAATDDSENRPPDARKSS